MFKKTLAAAALVLTASVAQADLYKPEDAVKYRQAIYQLFGSQSGLMGGMVRGDRPFDAAEINQRASYMANLLPLLGETYFPATRSVAGTRLNERAWTNTEDFQSKAEIFSKALGELVSASAQPDFDQAKARQTIGALGQSCRNCHDSYRNR